MGTLLDFTQASRTPSRVRRPQQSSDKAPITAGPAEIIFFPGVRYEREALELSARIGTIGSGAGQVPKERT